MSPHDEQRFAKMISDFVEGCGFERPFHLVVIDARGTASVTRYGPKQPLTVTAISSDGVGRSAKIEVVEAARTLI
jgi:hypothetical protein